MIPAKHQQMAFAALERNLAIENLHQATAIYTAEPVVEMLLDRINWPNGDRRLLDASCGDGVFLGAALKKLLKKKPRGDHRYLTQRLEGWEIHPEAAMEARRRISAILEKHGWTARQAKNTAQHIVINDDFLTGTTRKAHYHIIAGNPPYLRYANVPQILRREYETAMPSYARKDMLHSFLDRCVQTLSTDGEIALVTADRWLFNIGAAELRSAIGNRVSITYMERLNPASTFYRAKTRRAGTLPRVHPVALVMTANGTGTIIGKTAIYPDAPKAMDSSTPTLSQIATIRICPWLGKEGIFVIRKEQAAALPTESLIRAVDTDDIRDGTMHEPTRYAIKTLPGVEPPTAILAHLSLAIQRLCPTGKRHSDWWLPPETWHNLPLDKEALLIPRIARELCFYRLPPNTLAINHNLTIVAEKGYTLKKIEDILCSPNAKKWIRDRAAKLENGYLSITTSLLRQLPIK